MRFNDHQGRINFRTVDMQFFALLLVQKPAPVSNITVSPSAYSVNVTWKIRTSSRESSYITSVTIYINGKNYTTIPRGTGLTVNQLIPYTRYRVSIWTRDGSSQYSQEVHTNFTTSQAGKYRCGKTSTFCRCSFNWRYFLFLINLYLMLHAEFAATIFSTCDSLEQYILESSYVKFTTNSK